MADKTVSSVDKEKEKVKTPAEPASLPSLSSNPLQKRSLDGVDDEVIVYSPKNSDYMADLIAQKLNAVRGNVIRKKFPDGEDYYRIDMLSYGALVGKTVVYVCSTFNDSDFLELIRVGTTLAELGTYHRIFVIPYFGYSTMERAVKPGECVTAKCNARLLSTIPATGYGNTFLMMDLHVSGLLHYFEGGCRRHELYAEKILLDAIKSLKLDNFLMGTADLGRTLWVSSFATACGTSIAFVRKKRNFDSTHVEEVIGDVQGKHVVIYDDMCRSGGSLIQAAEAYLKRGAVSVSAVVSHMALPDAQTVANIEKSCLAKVICTNTHPSTQWDDIKKSKKIEVIDASDVFVQSIRGYLTKH